MRRQTPIAHLLYHHLYPRPTTNDPPSFSAHLAKNLVPEVRIEVATFYGDLNSAEARYPGLNYCYGPHRMRLGRFKHHRRLFDAFDNLGLTYSEVQDFCCWEGTKWARERYEKDEGVKVTDTTGNEIGAHVDCRRSQAGDDCRRQSIIRKTDISVVVEDAQTALPPSLQEEDEEMSDADSEGEDADVDEQETPAEAEAAATQQHISELRQRRQQAITRRLIAAWERGETIAPEVEAFLKEQSELGNLPSNTAIEQIASRRYTRPADSAVAATSTPRAAA